MLWAAHASAETPVQAHGALSVSGTRIVDAHGKPVALAGVSFFWSNSGWGQERFYNADAVHNFAVQWHATLIRAAMGVDGPGGYKQDPDANLARVDTLVNAAVKEGVYAIIDWHSYHAHRDGPALAAAFFTQMARKYGRYPNVIFEIYNEPERPAEWARDVKPYAEAVIDAIRQVDPDTLIIVGSPSWDQDVDVAAANPILGRRNLVYALHFYAGTHRDDIRAKAALAIGQGLPLLVSEWGSVQADGSGAPDIAETGCWQAFVRQHCLSQAGFAVSAKAEGTSIFAANARSGGPWNTNELTDSGKLLRSIVRSAPSMCNPAGQHRHE